MNNNENCELFGLIVNYRKKAKFNENNPKHQKAVADFEEFLKNHSFAHYPDVGDGYVYDFYYPKSKGTVEVKRLIKFVKERCPDVLSVFAANISEPLRYRRDLLNEKLENDY